MGGAISEKIKELEEMVEIVSIAIGRERGFIRYFEEAYKKTTQEQSTKITVMPQYPKLKRILIRLTFSVRETYPLAHHR